MWLIQWMKTRSEKNEFGVPVRNFAKVDDAIYRGALPDAEGYRALVERLGVRRVCSLIEHERLQDRELALAAGIRDWLSIPFSDREAPPAEGVRRWLDYVRAARRQDAVFTHCRGGRHRTGVLVGVYRVLDCGWTKEQAYQEMQRYGWYAALGHQPLLYWFFHDFDPKDYAADGTG